jgi:hypothetical protein
MNFARAVIEFSLPSVGLACFADVQDGPPFCCISFTVSFLQLFNYTFQTVGLLSDSLVSLLTSISINGYEGFLSMSEFFYILVDNAKK